MDGGCARTPLCPNAKALLSTNRMTHLVHTFSDGVANTAHTKTSSLYEASYTQKSETDSGRRSTLIFRCKYCMQKGTSTGRLYGERQEKWGREGGGGVPPSPGRNPSVSWCCCPLTSPNPPRIVDPGPRPRRRPHRRHPCPTLRGVTMAGQTKATSQRTEKKVPRREGGSGTGEEEGREGGWGGGDGGGRRSEVCDARHVVYRRGLAAEANRSTHRSTDRSTDRCTEADISTDRESIDRNRPINLQKLTD